MGFLTDRRGAFSYLRLSIFVGVLGVLVIVGGVFLAQFDQNSRRTPFFVELPQGAQVWGSPQVLRGDWQRVYYRVPAAEIEAVVAFYNQKLQEHYGTNNTNTTSAERCQRIPATGAFTNIPNEQRPAGDGLVYDPKYVPGTSVPFQWKCLFDRSGFNTVQFTQVIIHPGLPNTDPFLNSEGSVVIIYDQQWQP